MKTRTLLSLLFVALFAVACSNQKPEPLYSPSSGQTGYAERYPETLAAARGRFNEHESKSQQMLAAFSTYPDELKNPNWKDVGTVVELADDAGKSGEYLSGIEENEHVARFFEEEKAEINKKVGGAAQYVVKQKECDVDTYGATTNALEKSVEKQLQVRLRDRNEAQRFIADNEDSLGKDNVEKLKKQADDIAYVSYMTHVGVKQTKERIEELLAEAADVKKTLDRTIEESTKIQAEASRSPGQKTAAKARGQAAESSKQRIDSEVQQAEHVLKEVEERIKKLGDSYDTAFDALKTKIEQQPAAKPAS